MKRLTMTLILVLALSAISFSQSNIDSLKTLLPDLPDSEKIDVLIKLARAHWGISPATTIELANEALQLSQQLKDRMGEAKALRNIGVGNNIMSNRALALEYTRKSLRLSEQINDSLGISKSINNLGLIYSTMSDYDKSLEYHFISLGICEEIKDKQGVARSYNNIGIIHDIMGDNDQALGFFQKSLNVAEEIQDSLGMALAINNIGLIYERTEDYDKALEYYFRAITINENIGDIYGAGITFSNIGYIYRKLGEIDLALEYSRKSLKIQETIGDKEGISIDLNNIGEIYRDLKEYDKSYRYYEESIKLAREIDAKEMLKENYVSLSKLFLDQANYQSALEYHKMYSKMKASIFTTENSSQIAELQTRYDTEKKEKENELLRKDKEIQKATIKRQNAITISIGLGLELVLILALVMIRANNNKKKANQLLLEQKHHIENQANDLKKANVKLTELDGFKEGMTGMTVHDLKNPISVILNYSADCQEHAQMVIHQSSKQMLNMVLNILDVQKFEDARMRLETDDHNLHQISEIAIDQISFLSREKSIDVVNNIPRDSSVVAEPDTIERVLINLLTNAIKYTPNNGRILLKSVLDSDGFIKVSVSDNGEGIPVDKLDTVFDKFQQVQPRKSSIIRSTGLGLTFCKLAVESHGGEIGVESEIGNGTTFWFTLRKSDKEVTAKEKLAGFEISELNLSESEKGDLKPYLELLAKLEIYEVSDLREILRRIQPQPRTGLELWKEQMQQAVYASNEDKYEKLIKI
ncbi:MAG: sensor histidine kinase [candidate division Zixibacteria bacterium]|nr:sensor histidine kinase [candidate division Zixibacteria bacterium]